jgi:hypothetical protein
MKPAPQGGKAVSVKQEVHKLSSLAIIVTKYGLGSNGAPHSVVEFGV